MMIRLRPHHLLCILTYIGRGYSPAFTANMTRIAARLTAGEGLRIVTGPDDICAPLLSDPEPHCHNVSVLRRDEAARLRVSEIVGQEIRVGVAMRLTPAMIGTLRKAFAAQEMHAACAGCEWSTVCDTVAAGGFAGALLGKV